jgi:DNA-binding transcriptional regulator LsrR (DeoR family)
MKSIRLERDEQEATNLLNTVLSLYYMDRLTQAEIAKRIHISTPKVNRLLQDARDQGLVDITVHTPFQNLFELEQRLKAVFSLADVVVIPPVSDVPNSTLYTLGRVGANYLLDHLRDGDIVAISAGMAVYSVVEALDTPRSYDVQIIPFLGGVQGKVITDVNYIAGRLSERLGGRSQQLNAPAFADSCEDRAILMEMRSVKETLDIARRASLAVFGIGSVDCDRSSYFQFTSLSINDLDRIAKTYRGVGEIGAHVYDSSGNPVAQEYANRVIGLTLLELKSIPFRIGVAATAVKARPIYGALRGGYLSALITDELAARGVLEIFEQDFRRHV